MKQAANILGLIGGIAVIALGILNILSLNKGWLPMDFSASIAYPSALAGACLLIIILCIIAIKGDDRKDSKNRLFAYVGIVGGILLIGSGWMAYSTLLQSNALKEFKPVIPEGAKMESNVSPEMEKKLLEAKEKVAEQKEKLLQGE